MSVTYVTSFVTSVQTPIKGILVDQTDADVAYFPYDFNEYHTKLEMIQSQCRVHVSITKLVNEHIFHFRVGPI